MNNDKGFDSDCSDFDKCLFDSSGRLNINQIKSVVLKGHTPKGNYATNPVNNLRKLQKQQSSKSYEEDIIMPSGENDMSNNDISRMSNSQKVEGVIGLYSK